MERGIGLSATMPEAGPDPHLDAVRRPTVALGMITPSGNVVVERVTTAVLADFPGVSGHFSRTEVVGSADAYVDSYDWDGMLRAATLLSHARPLAICWNGSKGGSLGFDVDRSLCARIEAATGIRATTSTLAIHAALRASGIRRLALVTPYTAGYAAKIPPVFAAAGYTVMAEAHAGLTDNLAYAALPDADIVAMLRTVAVSEPEAILAYCTNLPAAHLVQGFERESGIPVYDSTSAGVWGALRLAGQPTAPGRRWGSLFGQDLDL
jgi:maleate isomerase